jgi:hypothetical protein
MIPGKTIIDSSEYSSKFRTAISVVVPCRIRHRAGPFRSAFRLPCAMERSGLMSQYQADPVDRGFAFFEPAETLNEFFDNHFFPHCEVTTRKHRHTLLSIVVSTVNEKLAARSR